MAISLQHGRRGPMLLPGEKWSDGMRRRRDEACAARAATITATPGHVIRVCRTDGCGASFPAYRNSRAAFCCPCTVDRRRAYMDALAQRKAKTRSMRHVPVVFRREEEVRDYLDAAKLECAICGRAYRGLHRHIERKHDMTAREYKQMVGLSLGDRLVGSETAALMSGRAIARDSGSIMSNPSVLARMRAGALTPESIAKAHEYEAPYVSTKKREECLPLSYASPLRLERLPPSVVMLSCDGCGTPIERGIAVAITRRCLKNFCSECRRRNQREAEMRWRARNPGAAAAIQRAYYIRRKAKRSTRQEDHP